MVLLNNTHRPVTADDVYFTQRREERKRLEVSLAPCPPSKRTFFDFSSDEVD